MDLRVSLDASPHVTRRHALGTPPSVRSGGHAARCTAAAAAGRGVAELLVRRRRRIRARRGIETSVVGRPFGTCER